MHHLYPSLKGDQLCPLGFHPQTRYPTRCKRCFRDYKEHGGRRGMEDVAASSPNLSDGQNSRPSSRSWTSTQNLSSTNGASFNKDIELKKRPQSWASTPDIDDEDNEATGVPRSGGLSAPSRPEMNSVDVTVKLPPRRHTTTLDLKEVEDSLLQNSKLSSPSPQPSSSPSRSIPDDLVILSTDSLAERVRKMNLLKKQRSLNSRESSRERSVPRKTEDKTEPESKPPPDRPERSKSSTLVNADTKRSSLPPKKTSASSTTTNATNTSQRPMSLPTTTSKVSRDSISSSTSSTSSTKNATNLTTSIANATATNSTYTNSYNTNSSASSVPSGKNRKETDRQKATQDVEFLLKIKDTKYAERRSAHDNMSLTTETTDTTLVGSNERELHDEIKTLRSDLESMKVRAERAERDKSDILLRRLASMETAPNRTAASEALMLQQKVNDLKEQLEKASDEKRRLNMRMKDIENNPKSSEYELKRKLNAAEQLCEELMEANQVAKKEIINLQAEMDELQDTYREDDIKAKTSLQKDLEKTTKNCRILSFKLKKSERKIEVLEQEKENNCNTDLALKVKKLEEELRFSSELTRRLQAEAEELRSPGKKKPPLLGAIGKSTSAEAKFTRESLTRGGSQEDPQQLLRDLQDSVERESDLKDQLKFAEEENNKMKRLLNVKYGINQGTQTFDLEFQKLTVSKDTQTTSVITENCATDTDFIKCNDRKTQYTLTDTINTERSAENEQFTDNAIMKTVNFEHISSVSNSDVTPSYSFPKLSHERELTPFAYSVFSGVAYKKNTRSGGLLFPATISRVLLSNALAGTESDKARKLSPTPRRLVPEAHVDRDEGISDEDDPAELRILLELNEQEASNLHKKVDELERENAEVRRQIKDLQDHRSESSVLKNGKPINIDTKRQLDLLEQELLTMRSKITTKDSENEKLLKENKRLQLQALRKNNSTEKNGTIGTNTEINKMKETLSLIERERDELNIKLKRIMNEAEDKLPPRTPKRITDLTPKNHLKKWVEELEDEITEMRTMMLRSGANKLRELENENHTLESELQKSKQKLVIAEGDIDRLKSLTTTMPKTTELEKNLKKSEEESKKLNSKLKDLEDKIKKQDSQIKQTEIAKTAADSQYKREKEKFAALEKTYEKERKERDMFESKIKQIENELSNAHKTNEKTKTNLEKEIKELKSKSNSQKSDSKLVQELRKQIDDLQTSLDTETKHSRELNGHWEKLSEETILMRAQLTTEKRNLESELNSLKLKLGELDTLRSERSDLTKRLSDTQNKIHDLEAKNLKSGASEYEKTMLKNKLAEKDHEYDRLRRENEMNIDLVFQLRKDNDDLNCKLSDFQRIEQAKSSINGHSASLEAEIKSLKLKLENSELQLKSEVASTRLRYEQQVKTLNGELTSMQRSCEKFKKDRDTFKQMLESAQKKIGELKANTTGRHSRSSMHSSDDDDKSKIAYLDQQIGCLEDQLVEARLEVSKVKTELVSERSANEIKISEMQSKLNEFEEERVIGSGRTKIPGMKTKLELSWQKEREDQQRLLQETSTLARDLRQTLFEVERERDKERLESKRRLDQLKRSTEEEMEEGRKKIAELQCDLLELRDVHAKLRTSNEKLRRERERYEKELVKRRMEQDGGERKVGALLQTVDELVKIAPDLKMATTRNANNSNQTSTNTSHTLTVRNDQGAVRRSRSPSPTTLSSTQISSILARLAEASEELRKFQHLNEDENERQRMRRSNLRRAASQENDPHGSTGSVASAGGYHRNSSKLSRSSPHNGSLIRKSLSLDQSMQQDQNIWRQDDGSVSSIQSIDSELGGLVRDSSFDSRLDSRLSGGSTQSDIPRGPRKKKKGLMGKLRSLTKSGRNSESEISIQGSDSDISVASDMRSSKKDLRGRLSGMFKRSGSTSRSGSTERGIALEQRPVAVQVVGDIDGPEPRKPPPANAISPKPIRSITKPPTPTPTTPKTKRRLQK
ncbi:myosin-2 heavy chain isoform X2 [Teleopsis dalmanni]|uniref:myosin-2 heavy chain isoform X2 n=1 Tax=Teleopsis dalmanni TaxID=139649 RepID=UPI0018CE9AD2|nr:myosin-2 heavy chain isoform X2 [Teleopsis dalmanni]